MTTGSKTLIFNTICEKSPRMSKGNIILKMQEGTYLGQIFTTTSEAWFRKWSVRQAKQVGS